MKLAPVLALALAAASTAGCGRAHLSAAYGRSVHEQFAAQRERREVGKAATGLDAQEASIIASTYRRSLAPREAQEKEQPILVVTPPQAGAARTTLAPSVPKE